nr:MAG TPA_asm: hypothetical protein [Caudoviricetes sp.]
MIRVSEKKCKSCSSQQELEKKRNGNAKKNHK